MSIQKLNTELDFNKKVGELAVASKDDNMWIYDDMQTSEKSGRFWRIFHTIFRLIGIDVYSHVRVNKVAEEMLEFAKNNKEYLNDTNAGKLINVLSKLDSKTFTKYGKTVDTIQLAIKGLLYEKSTPKPPHAPAPPPPPPPSGAPVPPPPAGKPPATTAKPATNPVFGDMAAARAKLKKHTTTDDEGAPARTPTDGNPIAVAAANRRKAMGDIQLPEGGSAKKEVEQKDFRGVLKKTDSEHRLQKDD